MTSRPHEAPIDWQDTSAPSNDLAVEIVNALDELVDGGSPHSVLGMLAISDRPLTAAQLSARSERSPSDIRRSLDTLECSGLVLVRNNEAQIHPAILNT